MNALSLLVRRVTIIVALGLSLPSASTLAAEPGAYLAPPGILEVKLAEKEGAEAVLLQEAFYDRIYVFPEERQQQKVMFLLTPEAIGKLYLQSQDETRGRVALYRGTRAIAEVQFDKNSPASLVFFTTSDAATTFAEDMNRSSEISEAAFLDSVYERDAAWASTQQDPTLKLTVGFSLVRAKAYQHVIDLLGPIAENPTPETLLPVSRSLGEAYRGLGRPGDAVAVYEAALTRDASTWLLRKDLAATFAEKKEFESAYKQMLLLNANYELTSSITNLEIEMREIERQPTTAEQLELLARYRKQIEELKGLLR